MGKDPPHLYSNVWLALSHTHSFAYAPCCCAPWCQRETAVTDQEVHKLKYHSLGVSRKGLPFSNRDWGVRVAFMHLHVWFSLVSWVCVEFKCECDTPSSLFADTFPRQWALGFSRLSLPSSHRDDKCALTCLAFMWLYPLSYLTLGPA